MFSGKTNPYDEPVVKATDEKQTTENWDVLLTIVDKVNGDGEQGARNVVAAIQKRLQHRNANVQLYSLTLADTLVKNCTSPPKHVHHEIASKPFTDTLKRMVLDRNTHERVRTRIAGLVREWTTDFSKDDSLGIMSETYEHLRDKGVQFDTNARPASPPSVSAEQLRREEAELQRALEESEREAREGRSRTYGGGSSSTSGQGSSSQAHASTAASSFAAQPPAPVAQPPPPQAYTAPAPLHPTRARALYDFDPDPDQPGELPLRRGDVVRIIDSAYHEWWRGELRGRIGIFPVTYVEVVPDPTPEQVMAEAQAEANVFASASSIDRLLALMTDAQAKGENVSDNEELSDLYQSCLALRPRILKLIEKYSNKRNELLQINERFVEARRSYEGIVDHSYAQHTQAAPQQYAQPGPPPQHYQPQPEQQPAVQGYAPGQAAPPAHAYHGQYPDQQAPPPQQQYAPQPHHAPPPQQHYDPPAQSAPGAHHAPPNGEPYRQNSAPHAGYGPPPSQPPQQWGAPPA